MHQLSRRFVWTLFLLACGPGVATAKSPFTLSTMPRIDVHAHMLWLCYSDEQLDYLRYMLTTYPNLHVDLAAVPEFVYYVGRENLRDFMIEYADRVLFGTDMGSKWFAPDLGGAADNFKTRAGNYNRYFDYNDNRDEREIRLRAADGFAPTKLLDFYDGKKAVQVSEGAVNARVPGKAARIFVKEP